MKYRINESPTENNLKRFDQYSEISYKKKLVHEYINFVKKELVHDYINLVKKELSSVTVPGFINGTSSEQKTIFRPSITKLQNNDNFNIIQI